MSTEGIGNLGVSASAICYEMGFMSFVRASFLFAVVVSLSLGCGAGLGGGGNTLAAGSYKLRKLTGNYTQTDTCPGTTTVFEPALSDSWNEVRVRFDGSFEFFLAFAKGTETFRLGGEGKAENGVVSGDLVRSDLGVRTKIDGKYEGTLITASWSSEQHTGGDPCRTDASGSGTLEASP
jgi:hypothetical protein